MYICTYTYICAHAHNHTHAHTRTHTHTHTRTHTRTHRHTDTQTHRHTGTQAHRHIDTQTHRHTDTQDTCTRTRAHTQTHTYIPAQSPAASSEPLCEKETVATLLPAVNCSVSTGLTVSVAKLYMNILPPPLPTARTCCTCVYVSVYVYISLYVCESVSGVRKSCMRTSCPLLFPIQYP